MNDSHTTRVTFNRLAKSTGVPAEDVRKVLKGVAIAICLDLCSSDEVIVDFLGSFSKRGRYWKFVESEFMARLRTQPISEDEFIRLLLSEEEESGISDI